MATEVWESLRGSAECVLCPSEQPAHDLPVGDVEDIACTTLVRVDISRNRRVAASNREQDFALATSALSEGKGACEERVPRGP